MIPVKKNETYTVEIEDMTYEGQGVAKIDNFTIFVKEAIIEEKIEIKIIKVEKNHAFAKIEKIIQKSEHRVEPICNVAKQCGGCDLQHMDYEMQLQFKNNMIKNIFKRAGLENIKINQVIGMNNPFEYRNKGQFPVGVINNKTVTGFYKNRTNEIVPIDECKIQHKESNKIVKLLADYFEQNNNTKQIRHIITRIGFKTSQIMITIVTESEKLKNSEDMVKYILEKVPGVTTIIQNINTTKTNVIMGNKNITLYGNGYIEDYISDFKFRISPLSFYQVNPIQTEVLYSKALEYANINKQDTVFDLYCGIGTISLFLSNNAKKVYGVEIVGQAIEDAKINAQINNIQNTEFICGDVNEVLPRMLNNNIKPNVIVIDPPRKGCEQEVLNTIIATNVEKIVYVSCNPETLAKDLKILTQSGYEIKEIQPVDMFAMTRHVETVVLLVRECAHDEMVSIWSD